MPREMPASASNDSIVEASKKAHEKHMAQKASPEVLEEPLQRLSKCIEGLEVLRAELEGMERSGDLTNGQIEGVRARIAKVISELDAGSLWT